MSGKKQSKENKIFIKCAICGYESTQLGLIMHLIRSHKEINIKDYHNKYIDTNDHLCLCGEELHFEGLFKGYHKTCGDKECISKMSQETLFRNYGVQSNFQRPECKQKSKITYKEKTGYEHNSQNPESNARRIKTNIETYGVDNPAKSPIVKERVKEKNINKYGVDHPSKLKATTEKRENKCLEKYGVKNVRQAESCKNNIKKMKLERYGDENYNNQKQIEETNLKTYGSKYRPFTKEERKKGDITKKNNAFFRLLNSDRLKDKVIPKFDINSYKGIYENNLFECTRCHKEFEDNMKSGKIPRCPICYPNNEMGTSKGEKEVLYFLEQYVKTEHNKRFYENKKYKYELDIFIPEYNIAIEYNGIKNHSEIYGQKDKYYHIDKSNFFKEKNI
jgi:hypothetical protein